jgi:hypothetical protein
MKRYLLPPYCLLLAACLVAATGAAPQPAPSPATQPPPSQLPRLVILDIELSGDLGGPELAAEHEARLKMASTKLRTEIERTHLYQVVDNAPAEELIRRLKSQQLYLHECNGCDLDVARRLGADQVLVAWVNRVSGLILTLTYEIHDVKTNQIIARMSFDFRGDNDAAWAHAVSYMVRDLKDRVAATRTTGK